MVSNPRTSLLFLAVFFAFFALRVVRLKPMDLKINRKARESMSICRVRPARASGSNDGSGTKHAPTIGENQARRPTSGRPMAPATGQLDIISAFGAGPTSWRTLFLLFSFSESTQVSLSQRLRYVYWMEFDEFFDRWNRSQARQLDISSFDVSIWRHHTMVSRLLSLNCNLLQVVSILDDGRSKATRSGNHEMPPHPDI